MTDFDIEYDCVDCVDEEFDVHQRTTANLAGERLHGADVRQYYNRHHQIVGFETFFL